MKNIITVDLSTFISYGDETEEAFDFGGSVCVNCECGYKGYVEADYDGSHLIGGCEECDGSFNVPY